MIFDEFLEWIADGITGRKTFHGFRKKPYNPNAQYAFKNPLPTREITVALIIFFGHLGFAEYAIPSIALYLWIFSAPLHYGVFSYLVWKSKQPKKPARMPRRFSNLTRYAVAIAIFFVSWGIMGVTVNLAILILGLIITYVWLGLTQWRY